MRQIVTWPAAALVAAATMNLKSAGDPLPTIREVDRTPGGKVTFALGADSGSYHVLRWARDLSFRGSHAVAIVPGTPELTWIADSGRPVNRGFYRIESYSNAAPGDIDGDGLDDLFEYSRPVTHNALNPAPVIPRIHGAIHIPTRSYFERLATRDNRPGALSVREIKFLVYDVHTDRPALYFADSNLYQFHFYFTRDAVGRYTDGGEFNNDTYFDNTRRKNLAGSLVAHDHYVDARGRPGMYTVEFWPTDPVAFRYVEKGYELIAAAMPFVDGNIAYHPASETQRQWLQREKSDYENSHVNVISTEELFGNVVYTGLNEAESFGRLRLVTGAETLSVRDIVIFRSIPNDLTHVSGIMTEIPQTPLSHINLKAKQNNTPNAYIKDAANHPDIAPLLGQNVYFRVDADGFEIRAASQAEVDAWFESIRPTQPQIPTRNLSHTRILPLSRVAFEDSDAFGSKAANLAELRRIIPDYTPDGHAVPFYFYDEFMERNGFYGEARAMIAEPLFQSSPAYRESRLKAFRDRIKDDGVLPQWMLDALESMHRSFPPGTTPRARSSTNSEDLEGFNGAGLYSSYTHHIDEDHFQKSAKQVWASLWNYRAFEEREFWRIDHFTAAMGILVHPNYSGEQANGVGVTKNIYDPRWKGNYINVQVGENLVTNPAAGSIPEEFLIAKLAGYTHEIQYIRFSNQVPAGQTILSKAQALELKDQMDLLHYHFRSMYGVPSGDLNWAMEIEFKVTAEGTLAIKQARPWVN